MILNSKLYDVLKYVALILFPAITVLWIALAQVWHLAFATEIAITLAAVNVFVGSLLGISSAQYKASTK